MKKELVFFVANIFKAGGIEKVVTEIANTLCSQYNVRILSLFKTSNKPYFELNKKVKIYHVYEKEFNPRFKLLKVKKDIQRLMRNINCDIFINSGMGYVPYTISMRKKSKYISWEHSNCMIGKKHGLTWRGRKLSNKHADAIVFLTKKDMKNFINIYNNGVSSNKYYQIYNPNTNNSANKKYNINSKKILSCGRLTYQKGFDILIDAAKIVFNNPASNGWTWDIYGEGKLKEELEKCIAKNHLNNKVILKGTTRDMNSVYSDYSFFVLTSRYEGFCMVNIEALNNKLPIISFNCDCGPDEIIEQNKNGYLIPCFETNKLANRIIKLISSPKIRLNMSSNASNKLANLELKKISKKWKTLIDEIGQK